MSDADLVALRLRLLAAGPFPDAPMTRGQDTGACAYTVERNWLRAERDERIARAKARWRANAGGIVLSLPS